MTKQQKIAYINKVNLFFLDAKNHGNGGNWWYPKQNRIAYNVKMHSFFDTEEMRKYLTQRQNEYYSDDTLYEIAQEQLCDQASMLSQHINDEYGLSSNFAGRSGGWLEVDYRNELPELENDTTEDVNELYKKAQELEELESKVAEDIKKAHSSLNKYIDTPEYYKDMATEILTDDETIANIYKNKIKVLTGKLK